VSIVHPIRRLAIVNRGEAAMRAIRSIKAMRAMENSTIESVALYTDVDREAPFVRHADRAIRLDSSRGGVAAYLDHDRLIAALEEIDLVTTRGQLESGAGARATRTDDRNSSAGGVFARHIGPTQLFAPTCLRRIPLQKLRCTPPRIIAIWKRRV